MKILFVIQKFESKPRLEDSAGYLEVARPLEMSGKLDSSRYFHFGKGLDFYRHLVTDRIDEIRNLLGDAPVVVYGAGAHSRFYMPELQRLNIMAFADSESTLWGTQLSGYDVVSPHEIESKTQNIIVSSRAFEEAIAQDLKTKLSDDTHIFTLYDHLIQDTETLYASVCSDIESILVEYEPDILFYCPSHPSERLPDAWFKSLKQNHPWLKLYTIWWDYDETTSENAYLDFERASLVYSDLVVEASSNSRLIRMNKPESPYHHHKFTEKIKFLSPPFDPEIFFPRSIEKTIDIAIFGSPVGQREFWINTLKQKYGERFRHIGGVYENETPLPIEEYAQKLSETKIVINTQTYPGRVQCKGKVKEALASGVFLLEEDNPETRSVVPEGMGVSYFSRAEILFEKIDYFLENDTERELIARAGYEWYRTEIFEKWSDILLSSP